MSIYRPARVLWNLKGSGLSTTLSVSGNSGTTLINIVDVSDLWLSVYDVQDPDGNWFLQVAKVTQLTSGPNYSNVSLGLHIAGTTSMMLPQYCRVAWTLGGTNPVFPQASISLVGR
jgi:hypothetical protein